jgi:hypothetical protein
MKVLILLSNIESEKLVLIWNPTTNTEDNLYVIQAYTLKLMY